MPPIPEVNTGESGFLELPMDMDKNILQKTWFLNSKDKTNKEENVWTITTLPWPNTENYRPTCPHQQRLSGDPGPEWSAPSLPSSRVVSEKDTGSGELGLPSLLPSPSSVDVGSLDFHPHQW